jgi:hypothetical protein
MLLMFTFGSHGQYEWVVVRDNFDLLEIRPEIVLQKYVAITSIDSSEFVPTDEERAAGWQSRHGIGYGPKIEKVESLPRDGWDEWYIFDSPADLGTSHLKENIFEVAQGPGHVRVFVNYCFALDDPNMDRLASMFWEQMAWIHPESYIADNDCLNFATRNKALFASIHDALKTSA